MAGNDRPLFETSAREAFVFRVRVQVHEHAVRVKRFPPHLSFRELPFEEIVRVRFTEGPAEELSGGLSEMKAAYERAKEEEGFSPAGTPLDYSLSRGYPGGVRFDRADDRPVLVSADEPRALAEAIDEAAPEVAVVAAGSAATG